VDEVTNPEAWTRGRHSWPRPLRHIVIPIRTPLAVLLASTHAVEELLADDFVVGDFIYLRTAALLEGHVEPPSNKKRNFQRSPGPKSCSR